MSKTYFFILFIFFNSTAMNNQLNISSESFRKDLLDIASKAEQFDSDKRTNYINTYINSNKSNSIFISYLNSIPLDSNGKLFIHWLAELNQFNTLNKYMNYFHLNKTDYNGCTIANYYLLGLAQKKRLNKFSYHQALTLQRYQRLYDSLTNMSIKQDGLDNNNQINDYYYYLSHILTRNCSKEIPSMCVQFIKDNQNNPIFFSLIDTILIPTDQPNQCLTFRTYLEQNKLNKAQKLLNSINSVLHLPKSFTK